MTFSIKRTGKRGVCALATRQEIMANAFGAVDRAAPSRGSSSEEGRERDSHEYYRPSAFVVAFIAESRALHFLHAPLTDEGLPPSGKLN